METVSEEPGENSRVVGVLVFVMHQVVATWCVFFLAPCAVAIFAGWVHLFGWTITQHDSGWILSGTPYYPVQVCLALFLGWSLGGWLQHRSMLWVWVIPSAILCIVVAAFPWIGQIVIKQYWYLSSPSRLSHFFGWGCRLENRCLDQTITTLPFYCSVAYSLGAWRARKRMSTLYGYAEVMNEIRMPRALLVGSCPVFLELVMDWRPLAAALRGWGWLPVAATLWAFIIELALGTYVFMVVISLIGRRSSLTRWFLKPVVEARGGEMARPASDF
jgi:hypothetical protein